MNQQIIPPKRHRTFPPVTILIDDADATATIITIDPDAFPISKREIAREIAALIENWMTERST